MTKRQQWIELARQQLLDGADFDEVIELLCDVGCTLLEAQTLVEMVEGDLREERAI
jgi:dihydroxyacetone kinase DhaKLM complex PTS-EIIA-like component DhaM